MNSSLVGWGKEKAEVAFAVSQGSLSITLFDHACIMDISGAASALSGGVKAYCNAAAALAPAPLRLFAMLISFVEPYVRILAGG